MKKIILKRLRLINFKGIKEKTVDFTEHTNKNRIVQSYMEFETCKTCLRENDLRQTNNVVLIHLSDNNSNKELFKKDIQNMLPFTNVETAEKGLDIEFNKFRF